MKLVEYLGGNAKELSEAEANAIGIPFPLTGEWRKFYSTLEVNPVRLTQIRHGTVHLSKLKRDAKARRRARRREKQSKSRSVQYHVAPPTKTTKLRDDFLASTEFLESFEWRQLRMEVLKNYGARRQCCGAGRKDGAVINVDHIKPRRIFPELALDRTNLQVLCHDCNHGKGNWDQTDWR